MALIQRFAVVDTPLGHAEKGFHQQRLLYKLGTGKKTGQVCCSGCPGDGWTVGVMDSSKQQVNQSCCAALILRTNRKVRHNDTTPTFAVYLVIA